MDYTPLGTAELADLLERKLRAYCPVPGKQSSYLFYFEGQDPLGFAEPASAIASLHRSLPSDAQMRLEHALLDLMGSRGAPLPDKALEQLILAVGNLRQRALLAPLVRRIQARAGFTAAPRGLYVMTVMVLKGFGAQSTVFEAARALIDDPEFPPDLLVDLFEILVGDESAPWDESFRQVRGALEVDHARDPDRVRERLKHTAAQLVRVSPSRAQAGLEALVAFDFTSLNGRNLTDRHDVSAALARALIAAGMQEPGNVAEEGASDCTEFLEAA